MAQSRAIDFNYLDSISIEHNILRVIQGFVISKGSSAGDNKFNFVKGGVLTRVHTRKANFDHFTASNSIVTIITIRC